MRYYRLYCAAFVFAVVILIIGVTSAHYNTPHSEKIIYGSIAAILLLMRAVVTTTGTKGKKLPSQRQNQ